jgi:hypothetical protein
MPKIIIVNKGGSSKTVIRKGKKTSAAKPATPANNTKKG